MNASGGDFARGDFGRLGHKRRVPGGAQTDVVRKHHRPIDVIVTMNGIHTIDQWDFQARFQGEFLEFPHGIQPGFWQVVA